MAMFNRFNSYVSLPFHHGIGHIAILIMPWWWPIWPGLLLLSLPLFQLLALPASWWKLWNPMVETMDVPGFFSYYDNMGISWDILHGTVATNFTTISMHIYIYVCNLTYMSVCPIVSITETSNCQFSTQYVPWIGTQIFSLSGLQRDGNASIQFGVHQLTLPLQYIHSIYTYRMISDSHESAFLSRLGYDSKALVSFARWTSTTVMLMWKQGQGTKMFI